MQYGINWNIPFLNVKTSHTYNITQYVEQILLRVGYGKYHIGNDHNVINVCNYVCTVKQGKHCVHLSVYKTTSTEINKMYLHTTGLNQYSNVVCIHHLCILVIYVRTGCTC